MIVHLTVSVVTTTGSPAESDRSLTGLIVWTVISVVIIVALGVAFGVLLAYVLYLKNEMKAMGSKPAPPVSAGGEDIKT